MEAQDYRKLLEKNVQSTYKKAPPKKLEEVKKSHQNIVSKLELEKRVYETTPRDAFFTIKDHKENYLNNPQIRVLNPTKNEIGRIAKQTTVIIIQKI